MITLSLSLSLSLNYYYYYYYCHPLWDELFDLLECVLFDGMWNLGS